MAAIRSPVTRMNGGQLRLVGGRRLRSPAGQGTRPTTARVREALMNILSTRLDDCHWLDLCSGSGVMGCEALERGAARVVAIEHNPRTAAICRDNLDMVAAANGQGQSVQVIRQELVSWLSRGRPDHESGFSIVYFDPPYTAGLYNKTLGMLHRGGWVQPEGLLICEYSSREGLQCPSPWQEQDRRRYGTTSLLMLSPPERCPGGTDSRRQRTDQEA